uniref:Sperm flagellar 2 n=1 Tax=Labrus bergylta TaxID=56723 RepID=A0A3Q3FE34_9LABR
MSDILCRWLNEELRLSKAVEPRTFAKNFSNGYLIGEVLHKYQLQNDFSMFMKKQTSISKLNNFTRIEPTLQLLGISFDINTAQDLMQEKQGVATRLLYQLYVSLEKKKKADISGTVMEIMQPAANAGLHKKEHEIYSDVVKRDAELKLQQIYEHYEDKCQQWRDRSVMIHPIQQSRPLKGQDDKRLNNIEKLRMCRQKHNGTMTYNQAAIVQVPRPPPYTSQLNLKKRQRQQHIITPKCDSTFPSGQPFPGDFLGGSGHGSEVPGSGAKLVLQSNSKYLKDIRQRLEESALAREQREKRRDRFLVEQLKAHEAQEEARRDEQLVKRLTRQTQQEQQLATQLLQMHMQKEVIRENRLFREQQYQQRKERDFQEALEREAALARQAKSDGAEEIRKELELCSRMSAERAQSRYKKHFMICKDIVEHLVDLATKVGEYRLLTGNLIPEKAMREWKELLLSGLPLYESIKGQQPGFEFSTPLDPVELKKQETLNNQDCDDYTNMIGEWRLKNIMNPCDMEPSLPLFPHFTLKACVLGKFCSGKTSCLTKIAQAHGIYVLCANTLIEEALSAYKNGEEVSLELILLTNQNNFLLGKIMTFVGNNNLIHILFQNVFASNWNETLFLLSCVTFSQLSTHAVHGAAAKEELSKGNAIPNELLVDIIAEAIRQVPAHSGWILDGFPTDIIQAHLLEKALGGSVDGGNDDVSSWTDLATDPNPPKPPPPPAPVLDLALLLDIPDECVVRRAYSQTGKISTFQETWPKLERWFGGKQSILVRVDADVDEKELYNRVESALQEVMLQRQEVMQQLRSQRTVIDHHLYNIREEFKHYLGRPDLKQELVSQWQKDFNSIADDMREDDDTKAELHLRLDELRERLWDISDQRKEEDEKERAALGEGWLEDHSAVLINNHSVLMQVELDRFQDTLCILRVYYLSMYKQVLPELPSNFVCIPLLDKDQDERQESRYRLQPNHLCPSIFLHACVCFPENSAKVRIALLKGHGLVMLHSLHNRAEQTASSMEKWLQAHYIAEMKSIDQLTEVVRYHIETGAKLQKELVLECTDFYLNGDYHMVASPAPPPRPSPLEKHIQTLTITQLEALHQHLYTVAPSGLMSSSEFSSLIMEIISVNIGRNTLPETWKNETQLVEIVSLLTDNYELIDWRRFLLSAALPWPFPSLTQLLVVLQRFKEADTGCTGYINQEQYQQVWLWFSKESVQPVPEEPSEPLPYDRLANLHKFFFKLFADHSTSPPKLDYVTMLQYFAADPYPKEGFIRALSVVSGHHLKHSSTGHLVKVSDLDYKKCPKIILGYKPEDCVPFSILSQHPFTQELMETSTQYQLVVKTKSFTIS